MKERPILMSGMMVRAILDGRKTQTRRIIQPEPQNDTKASGHWFWEGAQKNGMWPKQFNSHTWPEGMEKFCPHGIPGDRLWVRETFREVAAPNGKLCVNFMSDGTAKYALYNDGGEGDLFGLGDSVPDFLGIRSKNWKPSIFMPRAASRITLEIVKVRVEQLQDITYKDCEAEGMVHGARGMWSVGDTSEIFDEGYKAYRWLWNSLNEKRGYGWDKNPWVWVIEFKRV